MWRKILEAYYKSNSIVINQLESFEDFVNFGLPDIIAHEPPIYYPNYTIKFGEISLEKPQVIEEDRTLHTFFPAEARMRNINYDAAILLDITETTNYEGKLETKHYPKTVIGRMPIMIKSSACNLFNLSPEDQIAAGECSKDPGGYFIIKGNERVLVGQMRAAYNHVFVLKQKIGSGEKYKYVAEVRSMSTETGHSVLLKAMISTDDRTIYFSLPYIKEPIKVGIVFKALGYSDQDITNFIGLTDPKTQKYIRYIIRDSFFCKTKKEALDYIGQYAMHIIPKDRESTYAQQVVETELQPHFGISGTVKEQACFLGAMINKLICTNVGLRTEDDRDNYANKRVEVAGILLYDLFRNIFKKYILFIKSQLDKRKQFPDILSIISRTKYITKCLHQCLSSGTWGVQKNATYVRTGVSQVLERMSYGSPLSHLRRVIIPVGKKGKNTTLRQIHPSSWGMICPCETPEGENVGIVLNFALLTKISRRIDAVEVKKILETCKTICSVDDLKLEEIVDSTRVCLNGVIVGYSKDPDETVEEIRSKRSQNLIDREVSVTYDNVDNEIRLFCDEGRFMRPLLALKDNTLLIKKATSYNWHNLLKKGTVQYVDASELENSVVAMTPEMLKVQQNDYCEIHPSVMLGIMAALIPFSDHSQSPRNCYQCSMGKQALGIPTLSYNIRTDTLLHVLYYPQKPLLSTAIAQITGANDMPSGINAIVAIACYSG